MKEIELKKLLKSKSTKKIIYMHIDSKIYLSAKQLNYLIKLKNGVVAK